MEGKEEGDKDKWEEINGPAALTLLSTDLPAYPRNRLWHCPPLGWGLGKSRDIGCWSGVARPPHCWPDETCIPGSMKGPSLESAPATPFCLLCFFFFQTSKNTFIELFVPGSNRCFHVPCCIQSLIYLSNIFSSWYVPSTLLGAEGAVVNRMAL